MMKTIHTTPSKDALACPADCNRGLLLEELRLAVPDAEFHLSKFHDGWYAIPKVELSKEDLAKVAEVIEKHDPAGKPSYVLAAELSASQDAAMVVSLDAKLQDAGFTKEEIAFLLKEK